MATLPSITVSGPMKCTPLDQSSMNLVTTHVLRADAQEVDNKSLDVMLKSFWELESLGIRGPEKTLYENSANQSSFETVDMKCRSHGRTTTNHCLTTSN